MNSLEEFNKKKSKQIVTTANRQISPAIFRFGTSANEFSTPTLMKSTVFENEDYSTQNQLTKIYINSLVNNEKQSHCIYHIKNNIQTNTKRKKKHSHSRWLECVQNKKQPELHQLTTKQNWNYPTECHSSETLTTTTK